MEEGFRKEEMRKLLEGGRFFTVRSKKSGLLCIAMLVSGMEEIQTYQVIRYKDKRTKWIGQEELVTDFDPIDANPDPLLLSWISKEYKEKQESDESFRKLLIKKESEIIPDQTNAQLRSKSA
nr:hypothetical protein [Leptospira ainazelensis]